MGLRLGFAEADSPITSTKEVRRSLSFSNQLLLILSSKAFAHALTYVYFSMAEGMFYQIGASFTNYYRIWE